MNSLTEKDETRSGLGALLTSAAVVLATLVAGHAISEPPRGFRVLITILVVCWMELIFGLLAYWRGERGQLSSGANFAIMLTTAGSYAVAGLASVLAFVAVRGDTSEQDGIIFGILLLETVIFLVVLQSLIRHDDAATEETRSLERVHAQRVDESNLIAQAVDRLKESSSVDPIEQRRLERAIKRLYALQASLLHSHSDSKIASADAEVVSIGDAIVAVAFRFQSETAPSEALTEIEGLTGNLEAILRLHRIS